MSDERLTGTELEVAEAIAEAELDCVNCDGSGCGHEACEGCAGPA